MRFSLIALILLVGAANAETFRCQSGTYWSDTKKVIVTATINEDGITGTIKVAGVTHKAAYRVAGLNRRWNFEPSGNTYLYAFVIRPDGTAYYLDFSTADENGYAEATQYFYCR